MSRAISQSQAAKVATAFAKAFRVFMRELGLSGVPEAKVAMARAGIATDVIATRPKRHIRQAMSVDIDAELEKELLSSTEVTPDLLSQTLRRELKAALAQSGMSQRSLARQLGISPAVITRIFHHPEKSKVETLLKIAKAMDKNLTRAS